MLDVLQPCVFELRAHAGALADPLSAGSPEYEMCIALGRQGTSQPQRLGVAPGLPGVTHILQKTARCSAIVAFGRDFGDKASKLVMMQ